MDDFPNAGLRGLQRPCRHRRLRRAGTTPGPPRPSAVEHLAETYDAELGLRHRPDDFYDFQVNRPQVDVTEDDEREITWPTTEIKVAQLPGGRRPGADLGARAQPALAPVQRAAHVGAAFGRRATGCSCWVRCWPTPRTPGPSRCSISTSDRDAVGGVRAGAVRATRDRPGIVGVLGDALMRSGMKVLTLWAAIPHYVSHPPCPKATLALLSQLEELLDSPLDLGELPELAGPGSAGSTSWPSDDSEVAEYVRRWRSSRMPRSCPRRVATPSPPSSSGTCAGARTAELRRPGCRCWEGRGCRLPRNHPPARALPLVVARLRGAGSRQARPRSARRCPTSPCSHPGCRPRAARRDTARRGGIALGRPWRIGRSTYVGACDERVAVSGRWSAAGGGGGVVPGATGRCEGARSITVDPQPRVHGG